MPRAHRIFVPGHIWHITHRCHGKEFLLSTSYDRQAWLSWLRKAQRRFELPVLGYSVTCNHIHLLVQDPGNPKAIPRAMQLVQGRVAQEYNERTGRVNAFWGDRYHATAVDSGSHLLRCLAYIDLNMVRAGAVADPGDWIECGHREIHAEQIRARIIDTRRLAFLLGCPDVESLRQRHAQAVREGLEADALRRDERWSECVAVGSETFVESFAAALGERIHGREVAAGAEEDSFTLREPVGTQYGDTSSAVLTGDNTVAFDPIVDILDG